MELLGVYNWPLVVGSVIAAIGSAFVAISIVPRIYDSVEKGRSWMWVSAFGLSLGTGIWTMHFIAILALKLPIIFTFDLPVTFLSLLLAVVVSGIAIAPLRSGGDLGLFRLRTLIIGTLMGLGIAGMHYSGMIALRLNATMKHDIGIVVIAIMIAIVASIAALVIANQLRDSKVFSQIKVKLIAAIIMGLAVSAMHYTAMEGMRLYQADLQINFESSVDPIVLSFFLIVISFLIQGGIIITAIYEETYVITKAAAESMKRRASISHALSEILAVGLKKCSLEQKMEEVLSLILELEYLSIKNTGSIFITNKLSQKLKMVAHRNLPLLLLKRCQQVKFGECLCGRAAALQKMVYKSCVDSEHSLSYEGMNDHGHYCIPVTMAGQTLAVINLYLEAGHKNSDEEKQFLMAVADTLAAMINSHYIEEDAQKIFTAIDQAGEAVVISDTDGIMEYVNSAFTELTGYSYEESVGQKTSLLKSGNQDRAIYKDLWDTIISGDVWKGEIIQKRKDNTFYPAMLTVSPSRNSSGKITNYIGIHENLSEHKDLEAQFRQAQKMEAIGTLVGGIAHDFNNMLSAIIGNVYIAKQHLGNEEEVRERLNSIDSVSQRAAVMIRQLLTFSRKDMVNMKRLCLPEFTREVVSLLQSSVPENIQLEIEVKDENLIIFGDITLLNQVLMNLVINARDAVEAVVNPQVTISMESFFADQEWADLNPGFKVGYYAHMSISDNGEGISEENMENIFEPFFTTKLQGKGTGLGLSMVFGAVKSHSGFIFVDSTVGKGSVFHLYFPLVDKLMQENYAETEVESVKAKGETILLVDDEQAVREATSEVLESLGYKVLQAQDGIEGLEVFKQHHEEISLAMLDVVMPHLGGFEMFKKIRDMKPDLPTLFVTGYDRNNVLEGCEQAEHCEVISKPVHFNILSQTIRNLLDDAT